MGYSTDFSGVLTITPRMKPEHVAYINAFSGTRRMRRNANAAATRPDPLRMAVDLPIGGEGAFFVGETGYRGQDFSPDVLDGNSPPCGQPGLWCQWVIDPNGDLLEWDGGEKFYYYVEWLEYLIEHFIEPWGYKVNGMIEWQGEESDDRGRIFAENNKVQTKIARIVW